MVGRLRAAVVGCALVGLMVLLWVVAVPQSGGPDEPDHIVRGAALVRGQLDGDTTDTAGNQAFLLPPWVGWPNPICWAFEPYTPATCATLEPAPSGDDVAFTTRADDYQIWGQLLPGVGTLFPAGIANWMARVLGALIPIGLVGVSLLVSARRGWLAAAGTLLALTPMAWFVFAVVNPSGLVVAGGVALWVAMAAGRRRPDLTEQWLAAVGYAALVLPRRDGMFWAVLIVSVALLSFGMGLRSTWSALGVGPRILIALSTLATLAWASRSDAASARLLLLAPFVPAVAVLVRRVWRHPQLAHTWRRVVFAAGLLVVAVGAMSVVFVRRPGGWDREVLRIIVGRTGMHLDESIGVLGWLDTPIPVTMSMLWLVGLGMLLAAAVAGVERAPLVAAGATLGGAIVASWVLEMAQGDPTGTYWQGRYSLPFLVGIPIVLATSRTPRPDQLGRAVALIALVVANAALAASMRRWGVGLAGPMVPWSWNTYDTPLPPMVILALHAAASVGLWRWISMTARSAGQVVGNFSDDADTPSPSIRHVG